jgi:hypothetical protein
VAHASAGAMRARRATSGCPGRCRSAYEGRDRFPCTGHREGARNRAKVTAGDVFLRYLTKTSAFVGA